LLGAFLLLTILTGCPIDEDDCNDLGRTIEVPNLIKIVPLQDTYQKGDVVVFKIAIENIFEGINLFNETGDSVAWVILGSNQLFTQNELTFIKGSQGEASNWFNMPFDGSIEKYELEIKVKLNKIGQYSFFTGDDIDFIGNECNRYRISTNIAGMNSERKIEFEVLE